jgi:hypothetical protein
MNGWCVEWRCKRKEERESIMMRIYFILIYFIFQYRRGGNGDEDVHVDEC